MSSTSDSHWFSFRSRGAWFGSSSVSRRSLNMPVLYIVGGIISLALLVYLFVALLKPEFFS